MRVLISGAGIAGPTLAFWLARYGFEPTMVEKSPTPRTGGYIIDFWGAGYYIADRMGLVSEIKEKGYQVGEVRVVNRQGKRVAGFSTESTTRIAGGRFTSLTRSDLASSIFNALDGRVETIFDDSIVALEQTGPCVRATFQKGDTREFDLVVGADGLHSRVREAVFGPEQSFEKYLGYKVAAFSVEGYRPRDPLTYVMYTEVGQQTARFAMRDDRTLFLFILADDNTDGGEIADIAAQKALLRRRFGNSGWECPQILDAMETANDFYFDRVSQIRMGDDATCWTRNRVTLLGDAAFCPSFLAGQGSALAMVAAYILAGELHRAGGDYQTALGRYQELFAPFVLKKQNAALRFGSVFAPRSAFSMLLRNRIMDLLRFPWLADLAIGRDFKDRITLPTYLDTPK